MDGETVDPTALPWLLLSAASATPGPDGDRLAGTTYIQRVATTDGLPPAADRCSAATAGDAVDVPYTADYVFWKERRRDSRTSGRARPPARSSSTRPTPACRSSPTAATSPGLLAAALAADSSRVRLRRPVPPARALRLERPAPGRGRAPRRRRAARRRRRGGRAAPRPRAGRPGRGAGRLAALPRARRTTRSRTASLRPRASGRPAGLPRPGERARRRGRALGPARRRSPTATATCRRSWSAPRWTARSCGR